MPHYPPANPHQPSPAEREQPPQPRPQSFCYPRPVLTHASPCIPDLPPRPPRLMAEELTAAWSRAAEVPRAKESHSHAQSAISTQMKRILCSNTYRHIPGPSSAAIPTGASLFPAVGCPWVYPGPRPSRRPCPAAPACDVRVAWHSLCTPPCDSSASISSVCPRSGHTCLAAISTTFDSTSWSLPSSQCGCSSSER